VKSQRQEKKRQRMAGFGDEKVQRRKKSRTEKEIVRVKTTSETESCANTEEKRR
jgi:hypothetical protein